MRDTTIEEQTELIELVEDAGWDVSEVEIREHEFEQGGTKHYSVSIQLTVGKSETEDGLKPYQVK